MKINHFTYSSLVKFLHCLTKEITLVLCKIKYYLLLYFKLILCTKICAQFILFRITFVIYNRLERKVAKIDILYFTNVFCVLLSLFSHESTFFVNIRMRKMRVVLGKMGCYKNINFIVLKERTFLHTIAYLFCCLFLQNDGNSFFAFCQKREFFVIWKRLGMRHS